MLQDRFPITHANYTNLTKKNEVE